VISVVDARPFQGGDLEETRRPSPAAAVGVAGCQGERGLGLDCGCRPLRKSRRGRRDSVGSTGSLRLRCFGTYPGHCNDGIGGGVGRCFDDKTGTCEL